MEYGKIIFLNGVSSAGKSSLAKTLQETLDEPYFHISVDAFFEMIPEKYRGDKKIFMEDAHRAMHHSIAACSGVNLNLIVDHVLYHKSMLLECLQLLKDYPVLFVGVHCPVDELERRERERGNRRIGQARHQLEHLHKNEIYDIEVNTYESTLDECARIIKNEIDKGILSTAFLKMFVTYKDEIGTK